MTSHSRSLRRWTVALSLTLGMLIAVMGYLLWQDAQQVPTNLQPATDASSIRILRNDFPEISITKNASLWTIESPCLIWANEQRLAPLLGALQPGGHQYDASEVDLIATGLKTPMATVFLNEHEYRIGHADVDGTRRYVQQDNTVYFAPDWVLSLVNGGVTALARLELFSEALVSVSLNDNQAFEKRSNQTTSLTSDQSNNHANAQASTEGKTGEPESDPGANHKQGDSPTFNKPATITLATMEAPEIWQNLSAQQIATWPIEDVPATSSYSLTATSESGAQQLVSVYKTDRFTAIRLDDAKCAYILEPDALP